MKKFYFWYLLTLIIVALLPQAADAQQNRTQQETSSHVTAQQAMDIGYAFMHTGSGSKSGGTQSNAVRKQTMQLVYTGRATDSLTRAVTDCYYVFALQPKGFVIVAADDRLEPILGYSYDNDFVVENMPAHVRSWLGAYEKQIEAVAKSDQEADPAAKDKWMALKLGQPMNSAKNGTTVGPLLTTTWNQGQYYNNLCPSDAYGPAGHVYTGCVATAMAQIIHYWGYPTRGRGIHSYESNYGTLTVNYGSTNYNYTLMPDALTSASTSQEVEAVATLIRDCGVAVNMGYSPMESSSFDQDARAALINFFHYSPNLSFAEKAYFSESDWDAMLHNDLDNGRPIFYSGQGSGGHAFVCDGYNADGYYHFNFGWGGFADGWFLTSSITPGGSNFSSSQSALFGIVPDSTGYVILGQTQGISTFTVDEPLEFYHLMGHNAYEGGNYDNVCNNTIHFIPTDSTNQIVVDILDYEDQTLTFSDGDGNPLRSLVGGNDNDLSPVVSNHNTLNIEYSGNMYYAGFKLSISQTDNDGCRMVSNITSFVEAQTVHLTWTENGMASQWEIEYGVKGFALGTGTTYTATANTATFNNLSKFTEYDFYIRPVCGVGQYGLHNKISVMVEAEYWQDIVTSQPAGYVYNAQTNSIEISTAEGLAWWAKNVSFSYANPKVYLTADINLSGHKWRPAEMFYQVFDGQGHQITNAYIRENGNYIGFFSMIDNGSVENLGLTDSYIKGNGSCGGICGYNFGGMMRNSYVSNSTVDGSDAFMVGGLIGQHQGGVINCFVNAYVIGNHWNGLMIGSSLNNASVKNCYAAGTMKYLSWCNMGGIAAVSSEVTNCYSVWTSGGVVGNTIGPIADTSTFVKTNNGCVLLTPIDFDGVLETDLLSALNRGLVLYNDSSCLTWAADTGNVNGGFPVFGSNHYIVQCKDVSDVSVEQVFVNNNYGVKVSWTENGDANQWRIRYRQHDRPDTAYTIITTSNNPDTIYGMPLRNTYDFNVHAVCNNNSRSAWSETQSLVVDLPFWTDIVTTQPTGYVEDADGNVEIYSAEGLAWLSVITHGLHNQSQSSFEEKIVTLKSDIDLDGYRWYPIGNERWWDGLAGVFRGGFSGTFDGQNHSISNIYINGASGLFGLLHLGSVKNVILDGGTIIGGNGGLIGTAMDCYEIFNCHSSATVYGGGSLCGGISNNGNGPSKITVSNCSSSGTVYGQEGCGSLIGTVAAYHGDIVVRNCYATGNVEGSKYFIGGLIGYIRGAKIYNCFSTGHVEFNPDYRIGNVIGCQDLGAEGEYIYGQDNVNAGVALIGCSGNYPNTSLFHHEGNTNTLLTSVSINGETPNNLLDALNTWVISQNDPTLRTWGVDTLTGYPIFGDYFVPSCYNPSDLTVSQATVVGNDTIKTRLEWVQEGNPDHWEILYVANGNNIDLGTIVSVNSTPCVLSDIPVGQALDFYVRAVCDEENISDWCGPFTYIPDILRWTEVVTSKPEGFHRGADGNIYISSAEGLSWLSSVTNGLNGAQEDNLYDKQIFLTNDIDLSGYRWTPITVYALSFNGNNHVISGLYCNEFAGYQGLFGSMSWGNISNIVLSQCNVHGKRTMTGNGTSGSIGGIVGYASPGNIVNCIVTGNVNGGGIAGTLVGSSSGEFNIENCCFIGNDIFDGQSVGICESPLFAGVVNCYVVNSQNRYYIGEAGNSDFTGSGNTWTLSTPPYINGAFRSDLVDALNAWVDVNNTDGQYRYWVADTNMVNGGYPVFKTPPVFVQDTVMVSGYYSWHGRVFVSDTVVTDTLSSFNGYDSIVTYHIFVTPTPRTILTIDTCVSYILNGQAYYETGDYVQTFPAAYGGDSLVVLYLTIHQPTSGVDVQTACGSFTWIDGITYTENNNTATYTLTNVAGCDSIVTLKLTIGHPNSGDTTAIACDYFDWYEHNNLTENGDYTQTFTNKFGCDSVVTLHLTINHSNTGDTTAIVCDSFDWYEYSNLTQSGDYTHTFTNTSGCDSIVTLHLTVNHSNSGDTTAVVCNSFDWYEYTNLTQSGDYTRMLMNANGCDSVVTLHLSVITPPTVTTNTVSDITASSALCGGNVTDDGGVEVTERGVCWSTSQNPTIADSHIAIGMGIGPFTVNITDLTLYITYHVRAYATNSAGTAYGEDVTFTTTETPSTYSCGDNLIVGGNIYTTNLYGSQCWMTRNLRNANGGFQFEYPDVLQACPTGWHLPSESDWSLLGSNLPFSPVYFDDGDYWTSTLMIWQGNEGNQFTLISPPYVQSNNVTYTGSACEVHDAAQGNCVIHTPLSVRCLRDENAFATLPIVKTDTVINNTATSAICVGKVTADGGTEVTERGICWSTSANPTIVTAGAGTGTFTINLTDLTPNTTYHVRAYATNSAGTAYGDEVMFTTGCNPVDVTITSDKTAICEGECATLYASGADSYIWNTGENSSTITDCPTITTTYSVTGFNIFGCESTTSFALMVIDLPATPLVTVDNNVICDGGEVMLSITNPDPNPLTLYTWYRNGIVIPGATHTNFVDMPTTIGGETANNTYNVVATYFNSGCYSSSSALTVTVNDVPATPVLAVDNANVFEGAQVTVSVTNPIADATYIWYKNGVIIEDATQAVFVDYLTAIDGETTNYAYNVVAVLPISGCVSNISASTVVTVNALPTATVTVEGDTVLCDGGSVTLHVDVTPNDNSTYVYQWYEDGMLISGATSADYVVVKPIRDYPYNFMVVVSVMNAGFDITAHAPAITVVPAPMVTAFISDTAICEGGTVSMTAWVDGNNSGEGYNLQWFRETSGVLTAEPVGTDITYTTTGNELAGSYIYWLEVTNEYGCSSQSDPVMLTINQPTTGIDVQTVCGSYTWIDGITYTESNNTATYTLTNAVGCDSVVTLHLTVNDTPPTPVVTVDNANIFEGAQLTVSVTNPIDGAVYTWYRNGVILEGATQAVFVDHPTAIDGETAYYTYSVFADLPTSGCVSNISSSTMVTVNPLPVVTVTVEGNTVLCEGSSVTLHADVAPYNDPTYVYQWYEDGVPIPGATSADYVVLEPARTNTYNFMVMVSDMSGSFNITANAPAITVVPSPTVVASISESTICVGGTATLTATVEGGVAGINGYNFQWYEIAGTSTPWPEVVGTGSSYTTSGDEPAGNYPYWVMVSDEYGCSSQSGMVILSVVSQPAVTITRTVGYGEMVCEGGSTAIQANVTGGYGELSYQWYENGYILTDETNQFLAINNLAYGVNDTYTVMVAQTGAGCSNSASADINTLVPVYPSYTVAVSGPNEICEGGDLTMYAEANNVIPGDVLSYQWHEIMSGQDLLIEGANSIMYTAADLQSGSLYEYYVVVNSSIPSCSATSSAYTVNVNALSHNNLYETSCEYYTWNDTTYSESGEYTQTFTNAAGCDSIVTLHLTVNTPTEGDTTATVCGSFSWYEYSDLTQSGDYTHTLTNSAGCDSVVTLHLTVNTPTEGDTTAIVCGNFNWYEYSDLTQSGDYTHTLTNAAGCDSVVTLHLTVNTPTEGDTTAIVYGSFSWYEYSDLTQSGDYTHTLTNSAGCDSIVTLHLTVNAQWQVDSYDLNVNQVTGGTITMTVSYVDETSPGTVNSFSTTTDTSAIFESWIQLSADADYGYDFVDFLVITSSGDTLETPNNGFTMPAENVTVTAVFTLHNFNITVNVGDETPWGTVTGSGIFAYGSTDTLTATPMDEHHIFVGWSDYNTENPRVITVTHDSTITAYFVPEEIEIIGNDTVMGSVSVNIPGGGHLTPSTPIVITATPEPHYHFVSWSDGNTDNPRTIFPIQAIGLTAVFAIDQHTITVLSNDYTWGEVIGGGIYDYGTEISICANALAGYEFLSWGDGNTDNPRHITVEQDSAFTAIFQLADGINVANMSKVTVYSYTNQIVVVNAEGFSVEIFDMSGRLLVIEQNVSQSVRKYTIATDGIYLVKVGKNVFKKVKISR